jgi:hypothetical protein
MDCPTDEFVGVWIPLLTTENELQPSNDDQQNQAGNSGTSAHLASSLAKSEIRPQSVPKQQTQWDSDGPKEPQVPSLTAMTEQIVRIGNPLDGTNADVGPVRNQAEPGEQTQQVGTGHSYSGCDAKGRERNKDTNDRTSPGDEQRMWIVGEDGARNLERMEDNHFDGAASQEGPENVAGFVDGHHSQPSKRNGRADEDKLVSSPHGLTSTTRKSADTCPTSQAGV